MKIFISYSHGDKGKMEALCRVIEKSGIDVETVVIVSRNSPGTSLTDKVINGIRESDRFVVILTRDSIDNQWVNQEIGFCQALGKPILPIVEAQIMKRLKGFVHAQLDLPFVYSGNRTNAKSERREFRVVCEDLVLHLSDSDIQLFKSHISPKSVRVGETYTTKVEYRGNIWNGFFDNYVVHIGSDYRGWNWDPNTLIPDSRAELDVTPGQLNGVVDYKGAYKHATPKWPKGKYKIYVRLYSHLVPGEKGRQIVAEQAHTLAVR